MNTELNIKLNSTDCEKILIDLLFLGVERKSGLNPETYLFFNKIKGLTGSSPVEFLRKIKLDIAKKHLKENNCGVAEAAYLSGFNDVKYFSKCFKKEFEINPSEFKKSLNS